MAYFMLGEKPVIFEMVAMVCSFIGIVMIMSSKFTEPEPIDGI
jgi:hypothetical protein